jgi:cytochrome c peroxidase
MFRKRVKREYPPGTFIPTPARVAAILQLCFAFTLILWHAGQPFMGDLFTLKSNNLIFEAVMSHADFHQLSEEEQQYFVQSYRNLQGQLKKPFHHKLKEALRRLLFDISPLEAAWIFFSIILSILLLLRFEGAKEALWLLPLLTIAYAADNRLSGKPMKASSESRLFPAESFLVDKYLHRPLSASIFEQQAQLQEGWELYLIDAWAKESPSTMLEAYQKQLEKGQFRFNVARLKAVISDGSREKSREKQSLFVLALYLFWNFSIAAIGAKISPLKRAVSLCLICLICLKSAAFAAEKTTEPPKAPLGLPPVPWPKDNPYTPQKTELGRLLYFDKRLSTDGTVSCATCHLPQDAFADHLPIAIGIKGRHGSRNSPTVINAAYLAHLFWDGRASSLEQQCVGPIANPKEMTLYFDAHWAHAECEKKIMQIKGYKKLFKEVFDCDSCSLQDLSLAIATFERTVLSGNSAYDKYMAGNKEAMTPEQIRGMRIFKESGCANCHNGPSFSDGRFLNIGVGMDVPHPDLGRYMITKEEKDWGAFKVPILRDVSKTFPYMHDGSLNTLEEVIDYYDKGGTPNRNLHPLMKPLHLSAADKKALVSFLKALDGEGWQNIKAPETFPPEN